MKNATSVFLVLSVLLFGSLSCSFLKERAAQTVKGTPAIDLTTPQKGIDAKVELDKKQTGGGTVGKQGGSVSFTAADGSKFTLDVPADAVAADTAITMTAVKSIEGSPLESSTPMAVQLEPSGLTFKQIVTLTITPSKEIPVKNQIVFGYEANGRDYHLAPVDPKSKEIKVKLLRFSGVGLASSSDAAWAAHLMIQANEASTRLLQKLGEATQAERKAVLLEGAEGKSAAELFKPFIDAFVDQVLLKEIAAAELDCKHAQKALDDLIFIERLQQLAGLADSATGSSSFWERSNRLQEIGKKCKKSYRVDGSSGGATFKGEICSLDKPFVITVYSQTGSWPLNFTPNGESGGQMEGHFVSGPCSVTGSGPYTVSLGADGSGSIQWSYNTTSTCPVGSKQKTVTSKLPLIPAPDLSCP